MIDPLDVDLLAKAVAPLVAVLQTLVLVRRHVVVAIEVDVTPQSHVLDPDHLRDVVDVVEEVLDGCRFGGLHEHAHAGDPHDAPCLADRADHFVRLAARMPPRKRSRIRVRDECRLLRKLERIERRAVAAMGRVDRHSHLVHPLHQRHAEIGEAAIHTFGGAAGEPVLRVVRQLRHTLAVVEELIDRLERVARVVVRAHEVVGVLRAEQNPCLSRSLDRREVGGAVDAHEQVAARGNQGILALEVPEPLDVRVRPAEADRGVEDVDPGRPDSLGVGSCDRVRRVVPLVAAR